MCVRVSVCLYVCMSVSVGGDVQDLAREGKCKNWKNERA